MFGSPKARLCVISFLVTATSLLTLQRYIFGDLQRLKIYFDGLSTAGLYYIYSRITSQNGTAEANYTTENPDTQTTAFPRTAKFVSFDGSVYDGRRLGNQIFDLAAVVYVSELTGREVVQQESAHLKLEAVVKLNFRRIKELCPCHTLGEGQALAFDRNTENAAFSDANIADKTILISGFRQSWKYTLAIERRLRKLLVFQDDVQNFAENFLRDIVPSNWRRVGFVRVGIHVRRDDITKVKMFIDFGYTVPNSTYFYKAMKYFTDRYSRVQFIATSDDFNWTKQNIVSVNNISSDAVNVTHSFNHTAGQDLAILSMCDHVIMSTGTYGWWAAWLAKGITIYYRNWPRKGSALYQKFKREEFFPPNWIPMED